MLFKDVIAQHSIKQHLIEMVQQNRLSHALLFLGKEGSGSLPLAMAFAQYIVCEKVNNKKVKESAISLFDFPQENTETPPSVLEDACGVCPACVKAEKLMHPDIHYSYPAIIKKQGDKSKSREFIAEWREFFAQKPYGNVFDWLQFIKAENKQGNLSAEECNEIIRQLNLKSFESEYKILIMWMPEYLGNEGNKLLKLFEEPPPNTLFILVAESEDKILQTILSRTQLVKIPLLENHEIESALIERNDITPEQAKQIAAMSQGNYHEALDLLQHAGDDWLQIVKDWLNFSIKYKVKEQQKWIDDIAKLGREKQKQLLQYFNHLIEQSIRLRLMGADYTTLTPNEAEFAEKFNNITGITQQQTLLTEIDKCTYYIERNANAKMLFHSLSLKMYYLIINKVKITTA